MPNFMTPYEIELHIQKLLLEAEDLRQDIDDSNVEKENYTEMVSNPSSLRLGMLNQQIRLWIQYLHAIKQK